MLDLLVIWGHSSDDSISNPQVWRNRACKHAGLTQHSSNPDTYFPPVACLFITSYSFPPVNILASLIIILKEISCQLFSFSCLFRDHVPSQWENKKKQQEEPDGSIHGQPQRGMGMGYRLWELWFPLSFQKINVGTNSSAEQAPKTAISGHTRISPTAEGCLTFWTALNTSSCTCGTCILDVVCALCVSL